MTTAAALSFAALKPVVSIAAVLADHELWARLSPRRGGRLVGVCPLHPGADNPRAFVVDLATDRWHCFTRCRRGGDQVELARLLANLSYPQTAAYLQRLAAGGGGALAGAIVAPAAGPQTAAPAFVPFRRRLPLVVDHPFLAARGLEAATLDRFEAGWWPRPVGFLARSIGVRLHDPTGAPWGYAARRLDPQEITRFGKWRLPSGLPKGQMLYNWHRFAPALAGTSPIVLVEGVWGVMKLAQAGILGAVALLGLTLPAKASELLAQTSGPILLLLDGDAAGQSAAWRLAARLGERARVVALPAGYDPDDLPAGDLRELVLRHLPETRRC